MTNTGLKVVLKKFHSNKAHVITIDSVSLAIHDILGGFEDCIEVKPNIVAAVNMNSHLPYNFTVADMAGRSFDIYGNMFFIGVDKDTNDYRSLTRSEIGDVLEYLRTHKIIK